MAVLRSLIVTVVLPSAFWVSAYAVRALIAAVRASTPAAVAAARVLRIAPITRGRLRLRGAC